MIWPSSIKNENNFQLLGIIFIPLSDYSNLYSYEESDLKPYFCDRKICYSFPVLEGTKYSDGKNKRYGNVWDWFVLESSWIPFFVEHYINEYNSRCEFLIQNPPTKDMFREHSLFLLKESLKLFSQYSEKAKQLLNQLNKLN